MYDPCIFQIVPSTRRRRIGLVNRTLTFLHRIISLRTLKSEKEKTINPGDWENRDYSRTRPPIKNPKTSASSASKTALRLFSQKSALTHVASVSVQTGSSERSTIARERGRLEHRERWPRDRLDILYVAIILIPRANVRGRRQRRVSVSNCVLNCSSTETPRKTRTASTDSSRRPLQLEHQDMTSVADAADSGSWMHLGCTHQVCVIV